jgi:predicted nucleic acid-binding protein
VRVFLDTTVLVDHLRGHGRAHDWLRNLDSTPLCSELTRVEVLVGLREPELGRAERLFSILAWVGVDEPIARLAGDLGRRYMSTHQLGVVDLVIAATALSTEASLATHNVRHFPMFADLQPPY